MAKSEYWLEMAEEDLKDASLDIENSRFPSSVFHSQQDAPKKSAKPSFHLLGLSLEKLIFLRLCSN